MTDPHELHRLRFQAAQDLIDRNRLRIQNEELARTLRCVIREAKAHPSPWLESTIASAQALLDRIDAAKVAGISAKLADEYCSGLDSLPQ